MNMQIDTNAVAEPRQPLLCDVNEVARLLGIGKRTVWRWLEKGRFPPGTLVAFSSTCKRFRVDVLEAWIAENCPTGNRNRAAEDKEVILELVRQVGPLDGADIADATGTKRGPRLSGLLRGLVEDGLLTEKHGRYQVEA